MNCLECKYSNKRKKSKSCPDYIYCNRLEYWTDKKILCTLIRQKPMETQTKYIEGSEDNYTHIKFYYEKHTMIVNKPTFINYYPNAKYSAIKFEYLVEVNI